MSKEKTLLILGILVIILPNLGFPNIAEKIASLFVGFLVIIISYALHFEKNKKVKKEKEVVVPIKTPKQQKENLIKKEEEDVEVIKNVPTEEITGFKFIKRENKKTNETP